MVDAIQGHASRTASDDYGDAPEARSLAGTPVARPALRPQAALALSDRIARRSVSCRSTGNDRYDRASRIALGGEPEPWMVGQGGPWPIDVSRLCRAEDSATAAPMRWI
ncbi:hypothetical protein DPM13_12320 [Paracoccus mutanolyticus]|uniref:Uncharacterized protein n=1 Tax=Paracoccus mutanolyticus TaxID=1499308 RepID=A0ABM6WSK3_9RHOB|nr:hypothetical protein [Paracoccus mutanolyticus]AWX93607.1 hypothetical protein DPM13_12320 [Paracoccus mutanolyticus]